MYKFIIGIFFNKKISKIIKNCLILISFMIFLHHSIYYQNFDTLHKNLFF